MKLKFLFFLLFTSQLSMAQNFKSRTIDSLLNAVKPQQHDTTKSDLYNQISRNYIYKDSEKGIFYAKKAFDYANKKNWDKGKAVSYLNIGMHLVSAGKYDLALENFMKSEKILNKTKDNFNLGKLYNELGILKANQSKFPESLEYFIKSLTTFETIKKIDVKYNIASSYENIGTVYNFTNSYEKAIENYEKSIEILNTLKNKEVETAMNTTNIAIIYQKQNNIKKAIETYKKAETILSVHHDDFSSAFLNSWLGSAYLLEKKYDLSLEKSKKALVFVSKSGDKELTSSTIQNIGYAELQKGIATKNASLIQDAFENISKSLQLYKELGNKDGIMKSYLYLSEYHTYKKDFEKSLDNYKLYSTYNDSIYNSQNKQSLQNLQDERTIDLNKKEIQFNKIKLETKEKQKWFLISGLLLLAIIGGLLYNQSRNRKKINHKLSFLNNQLDKANKNKMRFFGILNHDLRSPVASLVHFLHLQKDAPELLSEETKARLTDQTVTSAEQLLQQMEDLLLWSKSQMEKFHAEKKTFSVNQLFSELKNEFVWVENTELIFENSSDLNLFSDKEYLKTILRNLIGNAVKVLENKYDAKIICSAKEVSGFTKISIKDNGGGTNIEKFKALYDDSASVGIKQGLGLHVIRDLCNAINAEIEVKTDQEIGETEIVISIAKG